MAESLYRIILADDHEIFRLGLKTIINTNPSLEVAGEAGSGVELIKLLKSTRCDLVILDLSMPQMDGFEILDLMSQHYAEVKRVVLSMHADQRSVKKAMSKQIDGFINKEDIANVILAAVQTIQQGKKFFSRDIQEMILSHYDELFGLQKSLEDLTKREKEIAHMIATGLTNKAIASQLNISIHTVQFHRSNIMSKLELKNTADLVKFVLNNDL
ncbi:MAG: response regulator transcription factor [Deltaproteobacteria bacterium]|nr:response regulator transcription factor [Deltaproteobacteria bacterium]MBT4640807.1 response regulator transcription factor [Deltaproteobacteria bacterium]MBT6503592.1 response regulator transcription factor [Deltaproteobacteria bacterium]MBT7151390.1 response regulator transcription factor [Deltaproteobacteria bacterium]MBT7711695.1 response regulator transcription factor [Deltaproteobacteria bacterium]